MRRHLRIIARDLIDRQDELFEHAPPDGVQQRLGLLRAGQLNAKRRALFVAAAAWAPLIFLAQLFPRGSIVPGDRVHVRYLIAAPLLVFAESACAVRLTALARHFLIGNLILERDRGRFERIMESSRRLLETRAAEVTAWIAAFVLAAVLLQPLAQHWRQWSPAMWWNALVSLPLLLVLLVGWAWRLVVWTRFLVLIARLDLRLVAAHPDRAGGLGFVAQSLRAFAIVAFAIATIVAGASARSVIETRTIPSSRLQFNIAVLLAIDAAFTLPLLALVPVLAKTYRRAVVEYGELAGDIGRVFEAKWLVNRSRGTREAGLQEPDFSATTDLYQVVANVYAMRIIPVNVKDLLVLATASLLPFLPLVLFAVPADVIFAKVKDLLL